MSDSEEEMIEDQEENQAQMDEDSEESNTDPEDEVDSAKIDELKAKIRENPYAYDNYVELIDLLRKAADLEQLREIREAMNTIFPLTPKLWLQWVDDEAKIAYTPAEREAVTTLYERAVKDYLSVGVWVQFVQFSMGDIGMRDGIARCRDIMDRSLTLAGLHVEQGSLLWEAYKAFEMAIHDDLTGRELEKEETEALEEQCGKQMERIDTLFKRQLSVPLVDMEATMKEYQDWLKDKKVDDNTQKIYKNALARLNQVRSFESELLESREGEVIPKLETYLKYLENELKHGNPGSIQCLYERALADHCLNSDLWLRYTTYLDKQLKDGPVLLPVHERAVRNCPWTASLWVNYVRAMERHAQPADKIRGLVDRALQAGLTHIDDVQKVWMSFLEFLRRKVTVWEDSNAALTELRDGFQRALDHLASYETEIKNKGETQHHYSVVAILKFWLMLEMKHCNNLPKARELWGQIMLGRGAEAQAWLEYAHFERAYGDVKHCRKVLLRGLHSASDWPELVGEALLSLEREEGTLESFDQAMEKCQVQYARVQERRDKAAQQEELKKTVVKEQRKNSKMEKKSTATANLPRTPRPEKRKLDSYSTDSDGFKIPSMPPIKKLREESPKVSSPNSVATVPTQPPAEEHTDSNRDDKYKPDPLKDEMTVFLSNLDFHVKEERIKEVFQEVGQVVSLRIIKDFKGRSKGYGYLELSSKEEAVKALKMDRHPIDGRPMYISKTRSVQGSQASFKFATNLEKDKLFVKNLPPTMSEEEVKEFFRQFGDFKQLRLSTQRNGFSKGWAYVEYASEETATEALNKANGFQVGNKTLFVAYSNPPPKKQSSSTSSSFHNNKPSTSSSALGGGIRNHGPRGRARSQITLVPRVLQKTKAPSNGSA